MRGSTSNTMREKIGKFKRWTMLAASFLVIFALGIATGFYISYPHPVQNYMEGLATIYSLKIVGLDLENYARKHDGRLPATLKESRTTIAPEIDPSSGKEFVYTGSGRTWNEMTKDGGVVLAYSSDRSGNRYALFSTGAVNCISDADLAEELKKITGLRPPQ